VPYALIKQPLDARITQRTVECLHQGRRVASHCRSWQKGGHTTVAEHMPPAHRHYGDWSPRRLIQWAEKMGPATVHVVTHILEARAHPQQGYRACLVFWPVISVTYFLMRYGRTGRESEA
jgi:transposase